MLCPNWGFRAGVENSRYTSTDSLRDTATALGLERTDVHLTAKLVYMLFRLENDTAYKAREARAVGEIYILRSISILPCVFPAKEIQLRFAFGHVDLTG